MSPTLKPHTTVILAMSADGKIADRAYSPARFGSATDRSHLEAQIALVDAVLFGAGTLRAYGTTLPVSFSRLLQQRQQQGKPSQPIQIVCSPSGEISPNLRFFQQPVPRWLLTISRSAAFWQERRDFIKSGESLEFERILIAETSEGTLDFIQAFHQFRRFGIERLAVLGGGQLVSALLELDLIDELQLTVCPLILGGTGAPSPASGVGFLAENAPRLQLLSVRQIEQEVFLHYRVCSQ